MKDRRGIALLSACALTLLLLGCRTQPKQEKKAADQQKSADVDRVRKAAEDGDAKAQFDLGRMLYEGDVLPEDLSEAAKWYRKACLLYTSRCV